MNFEIDRVLDVRLWQDGVVDAADELLAVVRHRRHEGQAGRVVAARLKKQSMIYVLCLMYPEKPREILSTASELAEPRYSFVKT